MPDIDLGKLIEEMIDRIQPIVKSNVTWWVKLEKIAEIVAPEIESVGQGWSGIDKKEAAMKVIDMLWFKFFDIKYVPNIFEKPLIDFVASKVIDAVVANFNKLGIFKHSTP